MVRAFINSYFLPTVKWGDSDQRGDSDHHLPILFLILVLRLFVKISVILFVGSRVDGSYVQIPCIVSTKLYLNSRLRAKHDRRIFENRYIIKSVLILGIRQVWSFTFSPS